MDGILPLFFLPPDYTGKDVTLTNIAEYRKLEEAPLGNDDNNASADETSSEETEKEENEPRAQPASRRNQHSAPVNAFSLLDSDSSDDEDSNER